MSYKIKISDNLSRDKILGNSRKNLKKLYSVVKVLI